MNPIRQSLHKAARHYASQAHVAWLTTDDYHEMAFSAAVSGHPTKRRIAEYNRATAQSQYYNFLHLAHRVRSMINSSHN